MMTNISAADVAEIRETPLARSTMFDEPLLPLSGNEPPVVVVLVSVVAGVVLLSVDPDTAVVLSVDANAVVLPVVAGVVLSVDPDAVLVFVDADDVVVSLLLD